MHVSPDAVGEEIVDAVLAGTRAIVAVTVRSMSGLADDITLAQYRTLIVLASRGPQRLADLAGWLGVTPPTAGRMCDRLSQRGYVARQREDSDRRVVRVSLTSAGRSVIDEASRQRKRYIATIMAELPKSRQQDVADALKAFAAAAGEVPDSEWPPL